MPPFQKPNLSIPPSADALQKQIIHHLRHLLDLASATPAEPAFQKTYTILLELFDLFQKEVVNHSSHTIMCTKGCSWCCYHWVEDVNSFEAILIAEHLKTHFSDQIPALVRIFEDDRQQLLMLDEALKKRLALEKDNPEISCYDPVDLLLSCFYQLKRPCPLLTAKGLCSIYPVRPLSCRIYVGFEHPDRCKPENINESDIPTYLLDLSEEARELIERLHNRYNRFKCTALREVLGECLRIEK
jgi:Fe-S-cluster containining protein